MVAGRRAAVRATLLALASRVAHGGGFDLGSIKKAVESVGKDAQVRDIQDAVQHAASDQGAAASKAIQGVDASRAVDAAKDAASAAQSASAAVSVSVGGGGGAAAGAAAGGQGGAPPEQAPAQTTASPSDAVAEPAGDGAAAEPSKADQVKKTIESGPLKGLLSGNIRDAVREVTGKKALEAIAKADPSALAGVADHGKQIAASAQDASIKDVAKAAGASDKAAALGEAVDHAAEAVDKAHGLVDAVADASVADKAKHATVQDAIDLVKTDSVKAAAGLAKDATLDDAKAAAGGAKKDDVKTAVSNPRHFFDNLGKRDVQDGKFLPPSDEDRAEVSGGGGGARLALAVLSVVVAVLFLGGCLLLPHLTKPRRTGEPMLSGEPETQMMTTGHWMGGGGARQVAAGGSAAGFSRF